MADLRTALSEALEKADFTPAAQPEADQSAVATPEAEQPAPEVKDRPRDEIGRFAKETGEQRKTAGTQLESIPAVPVTTPVTIAEPINRPSTWKKEYWPLYDKLHQGQALTPDEAKQLAAYTNERENQFKAGVSTYKAEADKAKEVQEALAPFLPVLQQYNIPPGKWIANLGHAHMRLAQGSPAEKIQLFQQLAREYGVPLDQVQSTEAKPVDPQAQWLSQQVQELRGAQQQFLTWQQQQEQRELQAQIARVRDEKGADGKPLRPLFESVREQMGGLLQSGMAQSLEDAYEKAVWMNADARSQLLATQQQAAAQQSHAVVQRAKASAISPKSASPSGPDEAAPKGLRATLAAQIDAAGGAGRV